MLTKKIFFIFLTFFSILLLSCSDNDDSSSEPDPVNPPLPEIRQNYGTVIKLTDQAVYSDSDHYILDDDGRILIIANNRMKGFVLRDGQRVTFQYRYDSEPPLPWAVNSYSITLFAIREIKLKDIIVRSKYSDTDSFEKALGNDPMLIHDENVWVGGQYLNMIYEVPATEVSADYTINLVYEDSAEPVSTDEDEAVLSSFVVPVIHLVVRYNSNKEIYLEDESREVEISAGTISFDLGSLGLEPGRYKISVFWNQYGEIEPKVKEFEQEYVIE